MNPPFEREAELALRAASTGGELASTRPELVATWTKGSPRDVATEMDERIERHIRAILAPSGHPFLGEETAPELVTDLAGPLWAVDPIDGTANWVSGLPIYAVSVGLIVGRRFAVGAVAVPPQRELFFTHGDGPAFLNGRALKPPSARDLRESLVVASFAGASADSASRQRQFALFGRVDAASRGCLRLGSAAYNICSVASGRLHAAYGAGTRLWDVAGALAVAEHAGYRVHAGFRPGSTRLDYVVGVPTIADAIRDLAGDVLDLGGADG